MFKKLIAVTALCLSVSAFAGSVNVDTSGLSDAQVAELKAHAAAVVAQAAKQADPSAVVAQATKDPSALMTVAATWGTQAAAAAEGFAKAIGIAAKELGVTVNDFLHTDAGKLAVAIILWKMAGAAVLKLAYGMIFFTTGMVLIRTIYKRLFTRGFEKVEYSRFGGLFKGTRLIRIPKSFGDLKADGEWLALWIIVGGTIAVLGFTGIIIT
jgi:hypothetical protein